MYYYIPSIFLICNYLFGPRAPAQHINGRYCSRVSHALLKMDGLDSRQLVASDKQQMQALCLECFPIDYPDRWFDRQLSGNADLFSRGVFVRRTGELVAIIVGQMQALSDIEMEYGAILNEANTEDRVMYIVIFGK